MGSNRLFAESVSSEVCKYLSGEVKSVDPSVAPNPER